MALPAFCATMLAQKDSTVYKESQLKEVEVTSKGGLLHRSGAMNGVSIGRQELFRAACCNLGESFTTNPSVDVSYSDAATGAKQIKLLGLSGTYVQMMTENVPNLRGAALPFSLSFVPGNWMQSIQVSKGASSVKNGYESITGQINIEYLKPQATNSFDDTKNTIFHGNAYFDSQMKYEVNADGAVHLTDKLSTSLLLHYEDRQREHDANGDGFMDMPKQRQWNGMWRMAYVSPLWISQLYVQGIKDDRTSGMTSCLSLPFPSINSGQAQLRINSTQDELSSGTGVIDYYGIGINTKRVVAQWKNGFTLNREHNTSIALMLQGSIHDADSKYGRTVYDVNHKNGYAQLMFETDFNDHHNLSVGASMNHDYYDEVYDNSLQGDPAPSGWLSRTNETTTGVYAQYTYKLGEKLIIMPGVRYDYSTLYDGFFTPRLHVKYSPWEWLTFRASAGKGYRTPHPLAENSTLLASGREIYYAGQFVYDAKNMKQEEAWNYGLTAELSIPVCGKKLEVNAEYYYTRFVNQMVININGAAYSSPSISFENQNGESFSHVFQIDATYPFFKGFTATGAFRLNDAKTTYDGVLRYRPLTSRYKGLLTLTYKTPLELWQFDVTGQMNGKGDLYRSTGSGQVTEYPAYFQLQAQITRYFRHFDVYLGGENLTDYKQKNPIISASNPWSSKFDATQIYGPIDGVMVYVGMRMKF